MFTWTPFLHHTITRIMTVVNATDIHLMCKNAAPWPKPANAECSLVMMPESKKPEPARHRKHHFEIIHLDENETPRYITSNEASLLRSPLETPPASSKRFYKDCPPLLASSMCQQLKKTKKVRFASSEQFTIHLTYSPQEYDRKWIRTGPVTYAIRDELNEFKRTEMVVHPESTQNTAFHYWKRKNKFLHFSQIYFEPSICTHLARM